MIRNKDISRCYNQEDIFMCKLCKYVIIKDGVYVYWKQIE